MPGWAGVAPLRRILAHHFAPRAGLSSTAAVTEALAYAAALRKADSRFHRMFPFVEAQMERLKQMPAAYLAHELLTRDWEAFSFGDLAMELAEAKLSYIGSAHLTDCVDRVNFTEEQQKFLASIADPILAEATRDMILARQFRRDVFAKGRVPIGDREVRARWLDTRFALTTPGTVLDMTFETALGKLQLRPDVYAPLIEVLGEGPITLRDLIERLPMPRPGWVSLTDAIKVLAGRGDVQPCLPAEGDKQREASTRTFNAAVLARSAESSEFGYLASPVTGGGIRLSRVTRLYLLARQQGIADPTAWIVKLAKGSSAAGAEGESSSPDETRAAIEKEATRVEKDILPLLRHIGIC